MLISTLRSLVTVSVLTGGPPAPLDIGFHLASCGPRLLPETGHPVVRQVVPVGPGLTKAYLVELF